jgi:serine/threonine-protein kinase
MPDAPRELAAIITRATDTDPDARYATAQAFADDLIAYRTGQPVAAMAGGRRYAVRKFAVRHLLAVGSGAAALLLLIGALVAVLVANTQARRAGREAEARFEQTRAIANAMLFDVFDKVSRVTGATAARTALATTSVAYLDALAAMRSAPADVRVEAGRGYVRLAEVTGGGQSSQLGRYADAAALLAKAESLLAPAYAANPNDQATAQAFAVMRLEQAGQSLYNSNDAAAARKQALAAEKAIVPFASKTADTANSYALAVQTQADSHGWNDEWQPALAQHLRAEKFVASLSPALQGDTAVMTARSSNMRLMGEAFHKLHREPEAEAALAKAVAINRALYARTPGDPKILRKLTTSLWYSAVVHRSAERDAQALEAIEEAMGLARQLGARDPGDAGGTQIFALVGEVLAQVRADAGDKARSYAVNDEVIAAHRALVRLAGNSPGARRSMATALATRGGNAFNLGDIATACTSWQETRAIYADLDRRRELSATDRNNGLPEVNGFIADYCNGGKPKRDWPKQM